MAALMKKLFFQSPVRRCTSSFALPSTNLSTVFTAKPKPNHSKNEKKSNKRKKKIVTDSMLKRRTRSEKEFDKESVLKFGESWSHVPVMLGEVLEVFSSRRLRSFVDCTLGAAGHSSAIIQAHPEMQSYVGLDVDPVAHEKARARINLILHDNSRDSSSNMEVHMVLRNFKDIKSALLEIDKSLLVSGVDGILMDLGMSSMQVNNAERGFSVMSNGPLDMRMNPQASLRAEDILNTWPDAEIGRILRDYGEESNWQNLQKKIVNARFSGGLHTTGELVSLIRGSTSNVKGGRQGWIKTATRVFQALRIAVNDELNTLKDSLYANFDTLSPGGRLAVISFHSLEDRIVKQTFLDIIDTNSDNETESTKTPNLLTDGKNINEGWIKQKVNGSKGSVLTRRPITPCEDEEKLNCRSRSAKLRVVQKL